MYINNNINLDFHFSEYRVIAQTYTTQMCIRDSSSKSQIPDTPLYLYVRE